MSFNQFIYELKNLNRETEIRVGIPERDLLADSRIFSSVSIANLKIPEGYQVNGSYITSDDGTFSLLIDGMSNLVAGHVYPDYGFVMVNPCANYEELAIAVQKINPDAEIRILNPELDIPFDDFISSNKDISELALPMGYYYDEEQGIINNVANFSLIKFVKEDKIDEAIEVLPHYDFQKDMSEQFDKDMYRMYSQLDPNYKPEEKKSGIIKKIKARFHK